MSITITTGSTLSVAKTYGPSIAFSTITNASDAVITTSSAHSVAVGEYVEVLSGWGRLNNRIARAKTGTTGSTLVLENINTTDTGKVSFWDWCRFDSPDRGMDPTDPGEEYFCFWGYAELRRRDGHQRRC
jgi:hypothetical protein